MSSGKPLYHGPWTETCQEVASSILLTSLVFFLFLPLVVLLLLLLLRVISTVVFTARGDLIAVVFLNGSSAIRGRSGLLALILVLHVALVKRRYPVILAYVVLPRRIMERDVVIGSPVGERQLLGQELVTRRDLVLADFEVVAGPPQLVKVVIVSTVFRMLPAGKKDKKSTSFRQRINGKTIGCVPV